LRPRAPLTFTSTVLPALVMDWIMQPSITNSALEVSVLHWPITSTVYVLLSKAVTLVRRSVAFVWPAITSPPLPDNRAAAGAGDGGAEGDSATDAIGLVDQGRGRDRGV